MGCIRVLGGREEGVTYSVRAVFTLILTTALICASACKALADETPLPQPEVSTVRSLVDQTGTLSDDERTEIEHELTAIKEHTDVDLGVIVVPKHASPTLRDFAYVQLSLRMNGEGASTPGALLAIDLGAEESYLVVNRAVESIVGPGMAEWASENVFRKKISRPAVSKDITSTLELVEDLLTKHSRVAPLAGERQEPKSIDIAYVFLAALVVGLGALFVLSKLRRAK